MIIRAVIFGLIFWFGFRAVKFLFKKVLQNFVRSATTDSSRQVADMVQDPVCKSYVSIDHAVPAELNGQQLYFCSDKCLETYKGEMNG